MSLELDDASIETIYAAHKTFLEQFWATGGRRRELMSLERFATWWETLNEPQRTNYLTQYETGYKADVDLDKVLNLSLKQLDPELMTLVESCHQKQNSSEEQAQ